jgi:hypothetical protein
MFKEMVGELAYGPFSGYPKCTSGSFRQLVDQTYGKRYWYDGMVSIDDAPDLPSVPGQYFILDNRYNVLYVGQSLDMRKRWFEGHHQFFRAKRQGGQLIGYVQSFSPDALVFNREQAKTLLLQEEAALIRLYAPLLNREKHPSALLRNKHKKRAIGFFERLAVQGRLEKPPSADSLALFFYAGESFLGRADAMVLAVIATRDRYPHLLGKWSCALPDQEE